MKNPRSHYAGKLTATYVKGLESFEGSCLRKYRIPAASDIFQFLVRVIMITLSPIFVKPTIFFVAGGI